MSERATAAMRATSARARRASCAGRRAAVPEEHGVYLLSCTASIVIATMGLNLTVGYAGQMSLGHAAFFGIGAYHAAILLKLGLQFSLGLPIAALACFALGLALGFPALRVQHHYLAFATLGSTPRLAGDAQRGVAHRRHVRHLRHPAADGAGRATSAAISRTSTSCSASLVVLGLLLWWLLRSPWGSAFTALRDNPIRAESLGVNITAYTLLAFAIGAACAGVGGVYFASLVAVHRAGAVHFSTSLMMYLMVIVGGSGRFFGPVLGTAIVVLLPELLRGSSAPWLKFMQTWYLVVFGIAVVVLMVWLPGGLLSHRGPLQAPGACANERGDVAVPRGQGRAASITARSARSTACRSRSGRARSSA